MIKSIILIALTVALLFTFASCGQAPVEETDDRSTDIPAQTPVVSLDDVNEEVPPVPEETRIWHEFKGLVVAEKEQNGVMTYSIYDEVHDFPYNFVVPEESALPVEEFSVGDYVRLFIFDEPGLYEVDEENIQTVYPDMILTYDEPTIVFYAEVVSVGDSGMHVKGLDISGRRYRDKEFTFSVGDKTSLTQYGMQIEFSEFKPGDIVAIYFCGEIMEKKPAGIPDVRIVEKLNDDSEENYVWHEFEGLIVSIDEVDGVTEYMLQDSRNGIVFSFIRSDAPTANIDEIQVGNHVNIYIYDEEGKYRPDDIDGGTVTADVVTVLDTFGSVFYAEIVRKTESSLQVKGLEINSRNYRGEYVFKVYESTRITDDFGSITFDDLEVGDLIKVYSFGYKAEQEPAVLGEIQRIVRIN